LGSSDDLGADRQLGVSRSRTHCSRLVFSTQALVPKICNHSLSRTLSLGSLPHTGSATDSSDGGRAGYFELCRRHRTCARMCYLDPVFPRLEAGSRYVHAMKDLTMRWSERRTVVRSTFEITLTLPLRATRDLVRRRSSCSR